MVYYYVRGNEGGNAVSLSYVTPNSGIIESGENTRVRLNLQGAVLAGPLAVGSFTLEIKPPVGASTLLQRKLPSGYNGGYIS